MNVPSRHFPTVRRVVIVEDDPPTRLLLEVAVATDGWEFRSFRRLCDSRQEMAWADVLVLDAHAVVSTADRSGTEIIDAVRHMPTIVLTSQSAGRSVAASQGTTSVIVKPFDAGEVLSELDRLYPHDLVIDLRDHHEPDGPQPTSIIAPRGRA